MQCRNHSSVAAAGNCQGCGLAYCPDCLLPISGHSYCATCKMTLVEGSNPPPPPLGKILPQARNALLLAIAGMFCAFLVEPWALAKAAEASRMLDADPSLEGRGVVTSAQIIAALQMAIWVLCTLVWLVAHG